MLQSGKLLADLIPSAPVTRSRRPILKEILTVLRRFILSALATALLAGAVFSSAPAAFAAPAPPQNEKTQKEAPAAKPAKADPKNPTAEQVAETVIFAYGFRERLAQIRRTGVERGRVTRINDDGGTEEVTYERSFMRGTTSDKDKVRLDQRKPTLEYSLIFNEGRVWGLVKGTTFTPRQDEVSDFISQYHHGIDALLRYKENNSTVTLAGKDKQKNIDMWMLDLTDKDKRTTRYYISSTSWRVLWLEYEEAAKGGGAPVKYKRTFHDYRVVQGTRVPYRSVLYADGKQLEELQVMTVTYGIKMEDTIFQTSDAAAAVSPSGAQ